MITVHVPAMTGRQDVRAISACISDVPGVRTVQADLATRTVRVTGPADPAAVAAAVTAAVTAAGYAVAEPASPAARVENLAISPVRRPGPLADRHVRPHQPSYRGVPMLSSTPRTFIGSTTFTVTGMTCEHCQRAVTEEISVVDGVESVTVDLASGTVTVTASQPVDRADIAAAVDEAGYGLVP